MSLLQARKGHLSHLFFTGQMLQTPTISVVSPEYPPVYQCVSCTRSPKLDAVLRCGIMNADQSGMTTLLDITGSAPVSAAQEAVTHPCCQVMLLAAVQLAVPRPSAPFCRAAPWWPASLQGSFLSRCRTWHFSLLNFIRFLLTRSPILSQSLWMAALALSILTDPTNLVSSANSTKAHSSLHPGH